MGTVLQFKSKEISMQPQLDTLKQYTEFLIEYDPDDNLVYISGLTKDDFWDEISIEDDVAEPESYAWGYHDCLKQMGYFSTVSQVDYEE